VVGIEPDPVTRRLVALYLTPRGYAVNLVERVQDALALVAGGPPALFLYNDCALRDANPGLLDALAASLGEVPVYALLEPGREAQPGTPPLPLRGTLSKPLRSEELLGALSREPGTPPNAQAAGPPPGGEPPTFAEPPAETPAETPGGPPADPLAGLLAFIAEMEMDEQMLAELISSFRQRGETYLKDLQRAFAARDTPQLERTAHAFKGMAGNLRLQLPTELADRLRHALLADDWEQAGPLVSRLEAAFAEVRAALAKRWPEQG
jgi:HPt (histidine-containing phosphotransfer) domain-containing protein